MVRRVKKEILLFRFHMKEQYILTPEQKKTPEYAAMRQRVDEIKAEMRKVNEDKSLSEKQRLEKQKGLIAELRIAQELRSLAEIDVIEGKTPEGKEVKFELKEHLEYWQKFYKEHNIDWVKLPDEIKVTS